MRTHGGPATGIRVLEIVVRYSLPGVRRFLTPQALIISLVTVATAVAAVFFLWRRRPAPVVAESAGPEIPEWPPVPVLGRPTEEDLARMRGERVPRVPRGPRRPGPRWAVAGVALTVVAVLGQVIVDAVFDKPDVGSDVTFEVEAGWDTAEDLEPGLVYSDGDSFLAPVSEPVSQPVDDRDADCFPPKRRPVVAAPAKRTTRLVDHQWRRIERWLAAKAPRTRATLAGPATLKRIAAAEAKTGLRFPDDLKASLLRHDGSVTSRRAWGFGILGDELLPVAGMASNWKMLCEIDTMNYDDRFDWWDGRMIPFAASLGGDHLVIDSVVGDVGDTDHEGSMSFTPGGREIRSYLELLRLTADALEKGGQVGYWKPAVVKGELEWDVIVD